MASTSSPASRYHLLYNDVYKIRASVLRLTNTYGPGMRVKDARQTFLGIWIRRLLEGSTIQVFGTGEQRRDFNFIDDVVDALLAAAANPASEGEIFNLGHHEHVTLRALADLLVEMRPSGRYEVVPFPADRQAIDIGDYYSDFSKIGRALGWEPSVPSGRAGANRRLLRTASCPLLERWRMIQMNAFTAEPADLLRAELEAVARVASSGWFILGKEVQAFETLGAVLRRPVLCRRRQRHGSD